MKVILIDDEKLALNYFEHQLKSVSDFEIIGKYTKSLEGKKAIEQYDIDLVFLDIQIPDLNGMELAEQLLEKKPRLPIVFVTAYDEYAIKAFELNALDYILKPVSTTRLLTTIQRIKQEVEDNAVQPLKKTDRLQLNLFHQVSLLHYSEGEMNKIPLKWRTTKTEQLFLYLVQFRGEEVSKNFLIDLLWPDIELDRAYQQLYTAIYNIRKTLGQYSHHFNIKSIRDGYVLHLEDIVIDVEQFEKFVHSSLSLSMETITDFEKGLAIFTGDYLQKYDFIWVESERQRMQLQWVNTALKVVDWYDSQHEFEKALTISLEICMRYSLEEEAHFFVMKLYNAIGNFSAVHRQYVKLREILSAELQVEPRPDITAWYNNWNETNNLLKNKID